MHDKVPDRIYRTLFQNIGVCRYTDNSGNVLEGEEACDALESLICEAAKPNAWEDIWPEATWMGPESIESLKRSLALNKRAFFRQKSKWKARMEKRFGKTDP